MNDHRENRLFIFHEHNKILEINTTVISITEDVFPSIINNTVMDKLINKFSKYGLITTQFLESSIIIYVYQYITTSQFYKLY